MKILYTRMKTIVITLFLMLCFTASLTTASAQPTVPGDIAFTAIITQGTTNDAFTFVAMKNIPGSFAITFTDNGYNRVTNALNTTEGTITWTAPAGGMGKGTEITIVVQPSASPSVIALGSTNVPAVTGTLSAITGSFSLASSGDQVIAYTGPAATPNILGLINWSPTGTDAAWDNTANPPSSNQSGFPSTFTNGVNCLRLGTLVAAGNSNFRYTACAVTSTTALASSVFNAANWSGNGVVQTVAGWMPACDFRALSAEGVTLSAKNKLSYVDINWSPLDEKPFDRYILERSYDGNQFADIYAIAATGSNDYQYKDADAVRAPFGQVFYRLRKEGLGRFTYSDITSVKLEKNTQLLVDNLVNPFTSSIGFNITSLNKQTADVLVSDLSGKVLVRKTLQLLSGDNRVNISEAATLSAGVYMLTIITADNRKQAFRLVKQ
jgi:hypothetical protein